MDKNATIRIVHELLVHTGKNAKQFSDSLGMARPQWLYDVLNPDKNTGLSVKMVGKICETYADVDRSYLLTGEGSLLKNSNGPVSVGGDQNGNVNSPGASCSVGIDKLIGVVGQQSVQIGELIKQNQDLINIISNLSKK